MVEIPDPMPIRFSSIEAAEFYMSQIEKFGRWIDPYRCGAIFPFNAKVSKSEFCKAYLEAPYEIMFFIDDGQKYLGYTGAKKQIKKR